MCLEAALSCWPPSLGKVFSSGSPFISCREDFDPSHLCLQGNKKEKNSADIHIHKVGLIFDCKVSFHLPGEWELSQG